MPVTILDFPIIGEITIGLALSVNILLMRYIWMYIRETRDDYATRLTTALIEIQVQQAIIERLKNENDSLKYCSPKSDPVD